jgi:hypothetical protein
MLFDKIYEAHHAWILSCSNLGMGNWLIIRSIFLAFQLSSLVFSTIFQMWFRLLHFSLVVIFWFVCTHPIDPMGIHLLHCTHGNEHMRIHDGIHDAFVIIAWNVRFHVGWKQLHSFFLNTFNFSHWQNQHCAYQKWNLHPSWHCHCQPNMSGFISPILCNLWICYLWYDSNQKKELVQLTPC